MTASLPHVGMRLFFDEVTWVLFQDMGEGWLMYDAYGYPYGGNIRFIKNEVLSSYLLNSAHQSKQIEEP